MDINLRVGDLRELQIYVNLKKKFKKKKKIFIENWKEMTIKEEINEMRKQLKNYLKSLNFNFLGNKIRNENFFSPKKKVNLKNLYLIYHLLTLILLMNIIIKKNYLKGKKK